MTPLGCEAVEITDEILFGVDNITDEIPGASRAVGPEMGSRW